MELTFEYRNAAGEQALRTAEIESLSIEGSRAYLRGYCHTRDAARTFRADRVITIADEEGELHEPRPILTKLFEKNGIERRLAPCLGVKTGHRALHRADPVTKWAP